MRAFANLAIEVGVPPKSLRLDRAMGVRKFFLKIDGYVSIAFARQRKFWGKFLQVAKSRLARGPGRRTQNVILGLVSGINQVPLGELNG